VGGACCRGHYPHRTVAGQKSKRRSRKRRHPGATPRPAPPPRREQRAERDAVSERTQRRSQRQLGTEGERPPSPFGGLPISELAIFAGLIGVIVGLIRGGGPALIVGVLICTLGVLEVTGREHFSGYRSHTMLLAAIPAVGVELGLVALIGEPRQRALLLLAVVPVYAILCWLLRKRFLSARQARIARPPAP
jgi:hypothetical protein